MSFLLLALGFHDNIKKEHNQNTKINVLSFKLLRYFLKYFQKVTIKTLISLFPTV